MSFPSHIKDIPIGAHVIRLYIDDSQPFVECEGLPFNHIWLLNQHLFCLSEITYLKEFAEIANFLWKGLQFQYIEDISKYQHFYVEQVELEKRYPGDIFPYRLTDYKIFDVSIMHEPRIENGQLNYFVFQAATGLPYKVICPFPYDSNSTLVHYQILPFKTEAPRF